MASTHVEVERKFDVPTSFALPDLLALPGVSAVEEPEEQHLEATYFDTDDLCLLHARITLRRRTGGSDAGWHLKLPATAGARLEVQHPLGSTVRTVPAAIAGLVRVRVRGAALVPVARLTTRRTVHRLLADSGAELAELVEDGVVAETFGPPAGGPVTSSSAWSEIEVELVDGEDSLLDAAGAALLAAGARPADSASKVGRALAQRPTSPGAAATSPGAATPADGRRGAARAVLAVLASQVEEVLAWDPHARVGTPGAVERMAGATHRLSGLLVGQSSAVGGSGVLEAAVAESLRVELDWLAEVLDAERCAASLVAGLGAACDGLPPQALPRAVRARVDGALSARLGDARVTTRTTLDGARYLALVDGLIALAEGPGRPGRSSAPARPQSRTAVRDAVVLMGAAMADAGSTDGRAAVWRARSAVEVAASAGWNKGGAARLAVAVEDAQARLQARSDAACARDLVRQLALTAADAGEDTFGYGVVYAVQLHAVEVADKQARRAWRRVDEAASRWPG